VKLNPPLNCALRLRARRLAEAFEHDEAAARLRALADDLEAQANVLEADRR
jgi:hypothetical protein